MRTSIRPLFRFQLVAALGVLCAAVAFAGCQRALFPRDAPRTQFEVHDRLRNRYRPTHVPDVFGNPQPALRARLSSRY